MDELYELLEEPSLQDPLLVVHFEGFLDAGQAASSAMSHMVDAHETTLVARFDADELLDHRSHRPSLHLDQARLTEITWPEIALLATKDADGRDVLLLVGPEPDLRWHTFAGQVLELADDLGVRLAITLNAFPSNVPHTRATRLTAMATSQELAARVGRVTRMVSAPAGLDTVLIDLCGQSDIPAMGIWAQVPHYVSNMTYPRASADLVDAIAQVAGIRWDNTALRTAAENVHSRLDELVAANPEHRQMLDNLEQSHDAQAELERNAPFGSAADLPSGDELADEVERFLRRLDGGADS